MKQSRQYWIEHVAAAERSGLPLSRYAAEHNVPRKSLYQWRSKLSKTSALTLPSRNALAQRFITVRVKEPSPVKQIADTMSPRCRLVLAPSISLELFELPDPYWLVSLQRAAQGI